MTLGPAQIFLERLRNGCSRKLKQNLQEKSVNSDIPTCYKHQPLNALQEPSFLVCWGRGAFRHLKARDWVSCSEAGPLSEWRPCLLQPHRGLDAQGRASSTFQRVPEGLTAGTLQESTVGSADSSSQPLPGSENPGPRAGLLAIARERGPELQRAPVPPRAEWPPCSTELAQPWGAVGPPSSPRSPTSNQAQ